MKSLPSRERGLKPNIYEGLNMEAFVAPLAGAWIETGRTGSVGVVASVAPLAGAWIETIPARRRNHYPAGRSPRGSVD